MALGVGVGGGHLIWQAVSVKIQVDVPEIKINVVHGYQGVIARARNP